MSEPDRLPVLDAVGEVLAYPQDLVDRVTTAIEHAQHCSIRRNKERPANSQWEIFDIDTAVMVEFHGDKDTAGILCDFRNSEARGRAAIEAMISSGYVLPALTPPEDR